ncbi:MAG: CoA-binding protein [Candidatus Micrarchaeota archaeon]|nr:CoA-binding protein [Candidatus Micrarchaeota archaeon]
MNEEETIRKILGMKSVAIVGISDNPERPSFAVAKHLMESGYEVVPVNPGISEWLGKKSFPDLRSVLQKVEVVDIFRKPSAAPEIVEQAIEIGAKAVWMQEGVVSPEAAQKAESAGLLVVMDKCMMKERLRILGGSV